MTPLDGTPLRVASPAGVRVWVVDLDAGGDEAWSVLSADERARAGRFVFDQHRHRFVTGRARLRQLLAAELGAAPGTVALAYGPSGKPGLAGGHSLRFNLSHSDRYGLIALAEGDVGVDIERIRPVSHLEDVARRVFTAAERAALEAWPVDQRAQAFFTGWTRKEAYVKAVGEGIGSLARIEVSMGPDAPPALLRVDGQPDAPGRWALHALDPLPGFAAAVCVARRPPDPPL